MAETRTFSTERIVSITDGVAGIAMTLLALNLSVPVVKEIPGSPGLWPELRDLWREGLAYITSFFMIGLLWAYHHLVFRHIRRANGTLLSLNLLFLMAVTLMPFSSALVARNWDERLSAIVYGASLFLAAVAIAGIFFYATWRRRLVDPDLDAGFIRRENKTAVWLVTLLAIGAALGYFSPFYTYGVLGVVAIFYWVSVAMNREGVAARRS